MPLTFAKMVLRSIPLILACVLFSCQPKTPVAIPSPGIPDLTIPAGSKNVEETDLGFPNSIMYSFDNKAGWGAVETHLESQLLAKGFFIEASETFGPDDALRFYLSKDRMIMVQLIHTRFSKEQEEILGNFYPEFNIGIHKLDEPLPEDEKGD